MPRKRGGGGRYYRPEDIDLLRRIRELLYSEGYTIKGVQRLLREGRGKDAEAQESAPAPAAAVPAAKPAGDASRGDAAGEIRAVIDELSELRDLLSAAQKRLLEHASGWRGGRWLRRVLRRYRANPACLAGRAGQEP